MGATAQTVTGTETERNESETLVVFGCTLHVSPRPLVSENSVGMSQQIPSEDDAQFLEANEQRQRQLDELQTKCADLVNRQHDFVTHRNEVRVKRAEDMKKFDVWCNQHQIFISELQKMLDRRREENPQN